jgi:hypothetical protein
MTTDEIKTTVKKHNKAAIIGGLLGLFIIAGYFVRDAAITPAKPDPRTAQAAEVVAYVSNERGLAKLAQIQQQEFLQQWRDALLQDVEKKSELKTCLGGLKDDERKAFTEAMFQHFKKAFLDDAKAFSKLAENERYAFLKARILEGRERVIFMKDVTAGLASSFTGSQDDLQKWVIEHTTTEERTIGEPYVNALKHASTTIDKDRRKAAPPTTSAGES